MCHCALERLSPGIENSLTYLLYVLQSEAETESSANYSSDRGRRRRRNVSYRRNESRAVGVGELQVPMPRKEAEFRAVSVGMFEWFIFAGTVPNKILFPWQFFV